MSDNQAETAATEPTTTKTGDGAEVRVEVTPAAEPETDLAAEVEKWKAQSRKNEDRAKANADAAKELERLKRESLPEQERMIEEAKAAARAEVLAEVGSARVADAVKLAAAGRPVDVDALLEGLDRSRFLGEDGQPDASAITAWVDRIAPAPDPAAQLVVDLGQGPRNSPALNSDQLLDSVKAVVGG